MKFEPHSPSNFPTGWLPAPLEVSPIITYIVVPTLKLIFSTYFFFSSNYVIFIFFLLFFQMILLFPCFNNTVLKNFYYRFSIILIPKNRFQFYYWKFSLFYSRRKTFLIYTNVNTIKISK